MVNAILRRMSGGRGDKEEEDTSEEGAKERSSRLFDFSETSEDEFVRDKMDGNRNLVRTQSDHRDYAEEEERSQIKKMNVPSPSNEDFSETSEDEFIRNRLEEEEAKKSAVSSASNPFVNYVRSSSTSGGTVDQVEKSDLVDFGGSCLNKAAAASASAAACEERAALDCKARNKELCKGEGKCKVEEEAGSNLCCAKLVCPVSSVKEDACRQSNEARKEKGGCAADTVAEGNCLREKVDLCRGSGRCVHFAKSPDRCCYKAVCDWVRESAVDGGARAASAKELTGPGVRMVPVAHPRECNRMLCPILPQVCSPHEGSCTVRSICRSDDKSVGGSGSSSSSVDGDGNTTVSIIRREEKGGGKGDCACRIEVRCFDSARHAFDIEYEFEQEKEKKKEEEKGRMREVSIDEKLPAGETRHISISISEPKGKREEEEEKVEANETTRREEEDGWHKVDYTLGEGGETVETFESREEKEQSRESMKGFKLSREATATTTASESPWHKLDYMLGEEGETLESEEKEEEESPESLEEFVNRLSKERSSKAERRLTSSPPTTTLKATKTTTTTAKMTTTTTRKTSTPVAEASLSTTTPKPRTRKSFIANKIPSRGGLEGWPSGIGLSEEKKQEQEEDGGSNYGYFEDSLEMDRKERASEEEEEEEEGEEEEKTKEEETEEEEEEEETEEEETEGEEETKEEEEEREQKQREEDEKEKKAVLNLNRLLVTTSIVSSTATATASTRMTETPMPLSSSSSSSPAHLQKEEEDATKTVGLGLFKQKCVEAPSSSSLSSPSFPRNFEADLIADQLRSSGGIASFAVDNVSQCSDRLCALVGPSACEGGGEGGGAKGGVCRTFGWCRGNRCKCIMKTRLGWCEFLKKDCCCGHNY